MKWRSVRLSWAVVAAALLLYPWIFTGAFYERMGADLLLAAVAASAWNIVGGYAGQISVGHAVFFGAGAYAPLLLYTQWQLPPVFGVHDLFNAEVADTWEVGMKESFLDRRVNVGASLFSTRSRNGYFFVFLASNSTQNLGNLDANYWGAEFEINAKVTNNLDVFANFGYTDSHITHMEDPTVIGNQAPLVTKDTANPMGGTYDKDEKGELNGRVTDLASAPFNKIGTRAAPMAPAGETTVEGGKGR